MNLEHLLWVFLISASPVVELRGAIPIAIYTYHLPWYSAFLVSLLGNLLPVPFIFLFLDRGLRLLNKIKILERIFEWLFGRTRRRGRIIERYGRIGLVLFVAIPFPVTGAWTGSLAAFLFGLKFKHAFLSIILGVFIAGVIVTALCLLGWVGALIAGVGLATLAILSLWKI